MVQSSEMKPKQEVSVLNATKCRLNLPIQLNAFENFLKDKHEDNPNYIAYFYISCNCSSRNSENRKYKYELYNIFIDKDGNIKREEVKGINEGKLTSKPSGESGCKTCKFIVSKDHFHNYNTHKIHFSLNHLREITCETKSVIYLITCKKCKKQYVGSTERQAKDRIDEHVRDVIRKKTRFIWTFL